MDKFLVRSFPAEDVSVHDCDGKRVKIDNTVFGENNESAAEIAKFNEHFIKISI